jgi:hypothetical protein
MDSADNVIGNMRKNKTAPSGNQLNNSGLLSDTDESKSSSEEESDVDETIFNTELMSKSSDSSETREIKRNKRKPKTVSKKPSSSSSSGSYESSLK